MSEELNPRARQPGSLQRVARLAAAAPSWKRSRSSGGAALSICPASGLSVTGKSTTRVHSHGRGGLRHPEGGGHGHPARPGHSAGPGSQRRSHPHTPPAGERRPCGLLANWETFLHNDVGLDPLIRSGGALPVRSHPSTLHRRQWPHGTVLNILYLIHEGLLTLPILYLSRHIIAHKSDYYRLLLGSDPRSSLGGMAALHAAGRGGNVSMDDGQDCRHRTGRAHDRPRARALAQDLRVGGRHLRAAPIAASPT